MRDRLYGVVTDARTAAAELWSEGRGWILVAVSAGWFLAHGVRTSYPVLIPFFTADFGIDLATAGLLMTALWAAYAVGQLPGGVLGDRLGEGTILVASAAVSAVAVLVVSTAVAAWMLFAGTVAFGFATALYGPTRFTIFTDIYPEREGSAVGLTMAAGSAGDLVLPVTAAAVASYATWQAGFGSVVPLFLVVAAVLWVTVPRRTSGNDDDAIQFSLATVRRVAAAVTRRSILPVVGIQVFLTFVSQGFVSFYPTYLVQVKGVSPATAATVYALFYAVAFVVQPLTGVSKDRFGTRLSLAALLGATVLGLWLLPFAHGLVQIVALTVLLSSIRGFAVVTQTHIASALPDDAKGTGLGALRTGFILFGATSPVVVGVLADAGYFGEAFMLLAAFASVALAVAVLRL